MYLKKIGIIILMIALLPACKRKKASLSGNEAVEISDFIESFNELKLPYQVTDSMVNKKGNDSLLISYKVFTQFVPDSILIKEFGKSQPKMYPLGRVAEKKENYLFVKAVSGNKKAAYLLSFNEKNEFAAAMPLLIPDQQAATQQSGSMDKKYTIYKTVTRKDKEGNLSEGRDVYVFNAEAKNFMLIMTDALDETAPELINPIDTLQKKNKFSGDYGRDKKNLVSIRDSKKAGRFSFFIHIEKNNGDCTGELKSEGQFTSANTAIYRTSGDPCSLQFTFTASSVVLKEIEGCGARRGLDCAFNGTFPRKKEAAAKRNKKPANKK